jgi:hypothetical protein
MPSDALACLSQQLTDGQRRTPSSVAGHAASPVISQAALGGVAMPSSGDGKHHDRDDHLGQDQAAQQ